MASPFERLSTETQGRVAPAFELPLLGDFAFVLGSDAPGDVQRLVVGESVSVEQTADVTGLALVRFRARVRMPESVPAEAFDLDVAGDVPLVPTPLRWQLAWGVGASDQGTRDLLPGRDLVLGDIAIDVSQLTGNQTLRVSLRLV